MAGRNGVRTAIRDSAKASEAAARALTAVTEMELRNGIVLAIKPVPPFVIRRSVQTVERPVPPKYLNPASGLEEENPVDPEYERQMAAWEEKTFQVGANVMLLGGTEVKYLPDGVAAPESDEWLDLAEYMRIPVELTCWKFSERGETQVGCSGCKKARYLSWLSLYAIESEIEWIEVLIAVSNLAGISESEVASAIASFRGRTGRRADPAVSAPPAGDGNNVPEAAAESST